MPSFSQTLTLKEAFESAIQPNEEVKWTELNGAFCKKFKLLLDRFFSFFTKCRKLVKKMTHRKKNRGHRTSKIIKSTQSYSNDHLPYYCSLYYIAHALDAWRGVWILCTVRMCETISGDVLKVQITLKCTGCNWLLHVAPIRAVWVWAADQELCVMFLGKEQILSFWGE